MLLEEYLALAAKQASSFFQSIDWSGVSDIIFVVKIISILLSFFFLIMIIYLSKQIYSNFKRVYYKTNKNIEFAKIGLPREFFGEKWQKVEERINSKDEDSYKLAIIEADNMFDDLLKKTGYIGEDMGERMKQLNKGDIPNLDELWEAHKLRNKIAHQSDVKINYRQAKKSIEAYKKAFQSLELI